MRTAFVDKLTQIAKKNRDIVLITGDLGFGVLTEFQNAMPNQYINAGVAEQNMTGLATGLAMVGKTVVTYSIGNFPTLRCLEQIRNDACYHNANVKIVCVGGGFSYGPLGISHHATEDISIMRAIPDLTVLVPGDKWEAAEACEAMLSIPGCCYLRLDKSSAPNTPGKSSKFRVGRARVLRDGADFTIIACGGVLGEALAASDRLKVKNIRCRVLSMHTIQPIDKRSILDACRQTGGIITVEENTINGGLGSAVAETCMDAGVVPVFFHRVGLRDGFSSIVGSQDYLRGRYHINADEIVRVILTHIRKGKSAVELEHRQSVS